MFFLLYAYDCDLHGRTETRMNTPAALAEQHKEPEIEVKGGDFVSVHVQWFNKGEWTERFNKPASTYCVAVCVSILESRQRVRLVILGDNPNSSFEQTFKQYRSCRRTWFEHCCPLVPVYTVDMDAQLSIWFNVDCEEMASPVKATGQLFLLFRCGEHVTLMCGYCVCRFKEKTFRDVVEMGDDHGQQSSGLGYGSELVNDRAQEREFPRIRATTTSVVSTNHSSYGTSLFQQTCLVMGGQQLPSGHLSYG